MEHFSTSHLLRNFNNGPKVADRKNLIAHTKTSKIIWSISSNTHQHHSGVHIFFYTLIHYHTLSAYQMAQEETPPLMVGSSLPSVMVPCFIMMRERTIASRPIWDFSCFELQLCHGALHSRVEKNRGRREGGRRGTEDKNNGGDRGRRG